VGREWDERGKTKGWKERGREGERVRSEG